MILLRAFRADNAPDVVTAWYQATKDRPKVRARLDTYMLHLRYQSREGWTRPHYDTLDSSPVVGEIRFKIQRINYRPLGFFGPKQNEFTFLLFATKPDYYEPRNAITEASRRRRLVEVALAKSIVIKDRWGQK